MAFRTPLAWKNLTADRGRLALACAGVAFAAVLMFMENGFRYALLDSPVQLLRMLRSDLVAISSARYSLPAEQPFPRQLLDRALGDAGVASVASLPIARATANVRVGNRPRRPIRVIGMPHQAGWFDAETELKRRLLRAPRMALLDVNTRPEYGFLSEDPLLLRRQRVELAGREVRIADTISIGTDFANEGTLLVSRDEFAKYFPFRAGGDPLSEVDLGLIRLHADADPEKTARRLTALAPREWDVLPREQLIRREMEFWGGQTPIGMIFWIGSLMGFAVGVIICYQILFTSIHDSMPEYATLKAMGYPNRFFIALVVRQSVYLSLLGFVPAMAVSFVLFQVLESLAGLPMLITAGRALVVLGLTVAMCFASGLLALRKLVRADPASLF